MGNFLTQKLKNGFLMLPEVKRTRSFPKRIVSVVPSQTELLYALGLDEEIVGITRFCIHPESWFRNKKRVGGTKKLHLEEIAALQPDLVIANKEENTKDDIDWLAKTIPVYVSDIETLPQALAMIEDVGALTNKSNRAAVLIEKIKEGFFRLSGKQFCRKKAAYFIWRAPWMAVGSHTFINEMMNVAGFENVFKHQIRYPEFTLEGLKALEPEIILLSSEPYPFAEKHRLELQQHFPNSKIVLVDGELFSWYGSRLTLTPDYLIALRESIE